MIFREIYLRKFHTGVCIKTVGTVRIAIRSFPRIELVGSQREAPAKIKHSFSVRLDRPARNPIEGDVLRDYIDGGTGYRISTPIYDVAPDLPVRVILRL